MKKLLLAVFSVTCTASVFAQGTIVFNNRIVGSIITHVYQPLATNPLFSQLGNGTADTPSGTTVWTGFSLIGSPGITGQYGGSSTCAQLLTAPGFDQPESSLVPQTRVATFRTGAAAGWTQGGLTVTASNVGADAAGTVEMVAWDNSSGLYPSWQTVYPAWTKGLVAAGVSGMWNTTFGGTNGTPYLLGLQSFNLYYYCPYRVPTIGWEPESLAVYEGETASFNVRPPIEGGGDGYQWMFGGTDIGGATKNDYSIISAQPTNAGAYSVRLWNCAGSVTSQPAILQLLPPGTPSIRVNGHVAIGTVVAIGSAQLTISRGFANGFIFYTLDGTTPTISSPFYTGPVTFTNSAMVQAMSLSADFSQSAFASAVTVQVIPVFNLQTSVVGSGTISVGPTNGPYASNTVVVLTANAAVGWALDHWTGDLTGSQNPASVTMNGPHSVQAVFVQTAYPLTATTPGGGAVSVNGQVKIGRAHV